MSIIKKYVLPDLSLIEKSKINSSFKIFIPKSTIVVLGKSSKYNEELKLKNICKDEILVTRRKTGGCSVVLTPNMFVISLVLQNNTYINTINYFSLFNNLVIKSLNRIGIKSVKKNGISDLSIDNFKIAGSAIYKNKNMVFFHIVINNSENANTFEKYLKFPPRTPEYRMHRAHIDFVKPLKYFGREIDVSQLKFIFKKEWKIFLNKYN